MIDRKKFQQAREWAEHAKTIDEISAWPTALAAAEVITALPDTIVDGDKLREVIERWSTEPLTSETAPAMVEQLREILPAPALLTLADMSPEERVACQWRVVDTPEGEGVCFKQLMDIVSVIYPSGRHLFWGMEEVVPLLDRPGMVWPE